MHLLYTDGSCLGNPGKGGWAARCLHLFDISGGDPFTTNNICLLYTSPSPRDRQKSRMPSSA